MKVTKLSSMSNVRMLSVLFDQNLNFAEKISMSVCIINRVKNLMPKNCLKLLYFALVQLFLFNDNTLIVNK